MKKDFIIHNDLAVLNKSLKHKNITYLNNLKVINYDNNYTNIIIKNNKEEDIINTLSICLNKYLESYKYHKVLIVGLGSSSITCDSLGVKTINKVVATPIIKGLNNNYKTIIYTYIPGILKDRGYSAFYGIKALVKELNIDLVIVIDSLVCSDIKYLNNVIQITNVGITPGSGASFIQEEISLNTLGIPVIAIGIATAIEVGAMIKKALKTNFKASIGYDFLVSSKDIDLVIKRYSNIISTSINNLFNNEL